MNARVQIGRVKCGACGKPVDVKLNKNGLAYYFCGWATDTGKPCNHHARWGREDSDKMRGYQPAAVDQGETPAVDQDKSETVKGDDDGDFFLV